MRFGYVLAYVAVLSLAQPAAAVRPRTERYFGHVGEPCAVPDVTPDRGSGYPGVASPSPPSPEDQTLITAFVEALRSNDLAETERLATAQWLQSNVAESCHSAIRTIAGACVAEPLYLLGDWEVRQTWVCGSRVPYQIFFTVTDGKVSNIWALAERGPVRVAPPPIRTN